MGIATGSKIQKTPADIQAKICKYLLAADAASLKATKFATLHGIVCKAFDFPVAESTLKNLINSLGIEIKGKRTGCRKERNGLGNARRIMFLAREVRNLFTQLGAERSDMLEKLCGGLELGEGETI